MNTIRITEDMKRTARENFGAQKFLQWAKREDSTLSLPEKVKLQAEMRGYLREQGISEGRAI